MEQNINTNITATANFDSLRTQLQAVTSQLIKLQATTIGLDKNLNNQIRSMNNAFTDTMISTGQFSKHFITLNSDVDKFGKNLDAGRLKLSQYFNVWQGHAKKTSTLVKDLAKQQVMLENAIIQPLGKNAQGLMQYNVMVQQGLDTIKNKAALARQEAAILNKVMQDGANQLINWGKNTQWAGRQLTVGLTVPMAAFGAAASKAFREADQELVRLTKVYGGLSATSAGELAKIRKDVTATAKELSAAYGTSFKDTISLSADLAATGKQGNDLLEATKQTTRLAVLGEVDRQEAMKATLAIQNAFKQNTNELTQSIDFLNAVENQTSTSLADLVEAIPKAGPVVKSLGGDVKDLALYLTAMKEGGVNAAEGANAIKSAMASLINPTKVATNMFQGFGIDLTGIVQKNAGNLTGTILELQSALDKLNPLDKSKAIEQLFGKFQFARMSALFENLGKSGSQTLQVMDLMKSSAIDLANISSRELNQMTESASGKYKRALESVKADLAAVGESFLTINTYVLKTIDGIVKFITDLPKPIKSILTFMGGLTALAGPLIMLTGVLGNFFGYVVKGIFHLKNLFKGGQGFKLLTPEIMAAAKAGKTIEETFYSDTLATQKFSDAVQGLASSFNNLRDKALAATTVTSQAVSTLSGNVIMSPQANAANAQRMADKNSPYAGKPYTRQMMHMIPAKTDQPGTIFGTVPGPGPVNVRVGKNPQMYMHDDMQRIPGLTSINSVSTGLVAEEAAKWHAMTAALATQSKDEIELLKKEVQATGRITTSLAQSYETMLPEMTRLTTLAANESGAIVAELQASKITVDQARAKVIALNIQIENMMAEAATAAAGSMGRTIDLTTVPLTSQPVIGPGGKSNMKELFHKSTTSSLVDAVAGNLGVRTSGAGYSIETTKPRKFATGGFVPGTGNTDTYETTLPEGSFVVNKKASESNAGLLSSLGTGIRFAEGGEVPVILTPGEFVADPETAKKHRTTLKFINSRKYNSGGPVRLWDGGDATMTTQDKDLMIIAKRLEEDSADPEIRRVRTVLHDAAILAKHVSVEEAIDLADQYYKKALAESYDSRIGDVNDDLWKQIRQEQLVEMDEYLKERNGKGILASKNPDYGSKTNPRTGRPVGRKFLTQGIAPTKELIRAMQNRGGFFSQSALKSVVEEISKLVHIDSKTGKALSSKTAYASGHTDPMHEWDIHGEGNLFSAIADTSEHNAATNRVASSSRGIIEDRMPKSAKAAILRDRMLGKHYQVPLLTSLLRGRRAANSGGTISKFAQRLFGGGKALFLGMPKTIKQVEQQRAAKIAMEEASAAAEASKFAKMEATDFGKLIAPTTGHSFPVPGIGGLYEKPDGTRVFVKPMLDETAALAEQRATQIAREAHGLHSPEQHIRTMMDPSDPRGKRKIIVLESKYDPRFAEMSGEFTEKDYISQLVASALRGDKDLQKANLSGNVLADVGTAGVFKMASGKRAYADAMPSMEEQAVINLLGTKGGAKKFFAEATSHIPAGMSALEYHSKIITEIDTVLPKLRKTIASFDLNDKEKQIYADMIKRLEDGKNVDWTQFHAMHLAVKPTTAKAMTEAAIQKAQEQEDLRRRQKGHAVSLSDNSFKTDWNGFNIGGIIQARENGGNVNKNQPYLVGEKGPELFIPRNNGGIIPNYEIGGLVNPGKYGYGRRSGKAGSKFTDYQIRGTSPNAPQIPVMPSNLFDPLLNSIDASVLQLSTGIKMAGTSISKSVATVTTVVKASSQQASVGLKVAGSQITDSLNGMALAAKTSAASVANAVRTSVPVTEFRNAKNEYYANNTSYWRSPFKGKGGSMESMKAGGQGSFGVGMAMGTAGTMLGGNAGMALQLGSMAVMMGAIPKVVSGLKAMRAAWVAVTAAEAGATVGAKIFAATSKAAMMSGPQVIILAIIASVTLLISLFKSLSKHNAELAKQQTLSNGMTEKGAKQAGIKYNDLSESIKNVNAQLELAKAKGQAAWDRSQSAGILGLTLTIQQLRDGIKKAKKEQGEFVDAFSKIGSSEWWGADQSNKMKQSGVNEMAANLKAQFVAAGMSAEEATNKIFLMIKASKNSDKAFGAISSKAFSQITDKASASASMVEKLNKKMAEAYSMQNGTVLTGDKRRNDPFATSSFKGKDLGNALSNTTAALSSEMSSLIGTKDENGKVIDEARAYEIILEKIHGLNGSNVQLNRDQIESLKATHPELQKILNTSDTTASVFAKWQLMLKGISADFKNMSADEAESMLKYQEMIQTQITLMEKNASLGSGILGKAQKTIDSLNKQIGKGLESAQKSNQKTQDQINAEIKLIDKKIKKIQEEADARVKSLTEQQNAADFNTNMQQLQLENQDALARGDMSAAAAAQMKIRQLSEQRQKELAIQAIRDKEAADVKKLEAQKEKMQAAAEASAKKVANMQAAAATVQMRASKLDAYQNEYERLVKYQGQIDMMPQGKERDDALKQLRGSLSELAASIGKDIKGKDKVLAGYLKDAFGGRLVTNEGVSLAGKQVTTVGYGGSNPTTKYVAGAADAALKLDTKAIDSAITKLGGGSTLRDVVIAIMGGHKTANTAKTISTNLNKYAVETSGKGKGYLTDDAERKIIADYALKEGEFFTYNGYMYRMESDTNAIRGSKVKAARGGYISGPGTQTSDSIPAMLSNGEYVINAKSAQAFGYGNLDGINKMAQGGIALSYNIPSGMKSRMQLHNGGPAVSSGSVYNVNIELNGTNVTPDEIWNKFEQKMKLAEASNGRKVLHKDPRRMWT